LEGTLRELSKENAFLKETQNSVRKPIKNLHESTLGLESKFQSEKAGIMLQTAPQQSPYPKENIPEMDKKEIMSEMPKKIDAGIKQIAPIRSVYNIDLEKYNQMMRAGGRIPGMIAKK